MKKLIATAVTFLLVSVLPAQATTVYFNGDGGADGSGSVETALPMDKLGTVPLPRGRFRIAGDSAEVTVIPEWQFDRHVVLSGRVLDTRLAQAGTHSLITGVVFFNGGQWLHFYDNPRAIETVNSGAGNLSVSGRITDVSDSQVSMTTISGQAVSIPLSTISAIHSPRVFTFSIAASSLQPGANGEPAYADARTVSFSTSAMPFQLSSLRAEVRREMDDGDIPARKLVVLGTFLSLVELGQLVPYMVIPAYSSKLQHQMFQRELFFNTHAGSGP